MTAFRFFKVVAIGVCSASLVGCYSVPEGFSPTASAELDAEAKQFRSEPGKANIYVLRLPGATLKTQ